MFIIIFYLFLYSVISFCPSFKSDFFLYFSLSFFLYFLKSLHFFYFHYLLFLFLFFSIKFYVNPWKHEQMFINIYWLTMSSVTSLFNLLKSASAQTFNILPYISSTLPEIILTNQQLCDLSPHGISWFLNKFPRWLSNILNPYLTP